jgi:hydrogen peroxide-dependent heme synthase
MRNISHDSPETAPHGPSTNAGTMKPSEPQAEARAPGHRPSASAQAPATLVPEAGWHFLHLFYRVDRSRLSELSTKQREQGVEELRRVLVARDPGGPEQLQCFAVPGHKADFGVIMAGPDLRGVHDVQMSIQASSLGPALQPSYSFYSITEISEYVPDVEQYGQVLRDREGLDPESSIYKTKVAAYAERLGPMNRQRLYPEFPNWPCLCFYPMSKMRTAEQNWYLLPFEARAELMSYHARSGIKFAGRVSQLITASTGLENWEWGVTLWGRNPTYLKDIVYTMRFDESSAKYALFGDFYFGYILPPDELLEAVRL